MPTPSLFRALAGCVALTLGAWACHNASGPGITLDVAPDSAQLLRNDSVRLAVNALDGDGHLVTGVAVSFASNDTTIVTVTNLGVVHSAIKVGRTIVRVSSGAVFTIVPVTVTATPSAVDVLPADTTILAGRSIQYRAVVIDEMGDTIRGVGVAWRSTDTSIATISANGLATAKSKGGTTSITASYAGRVGGGILRVLDSLIVARTELPGEPYGAAISSTNVAYVGQPDLGRVARANLSSHLFTSSVSVGSRPTEIAFNAIGTRAYVTNQSNPISIVNVASNTLIDSIPVGSGSYEIIVAPGDSTLYVAKTDSVYGVRLSTKAIVVGFAVPGIGNGIVIARDTLLYVSTHNGGTVVEFNLRTRVVGRTFAVGGTPQKLAVSPDGTELYIANQAGYVQFWNLDTGLQIGANLALPAAAYGMARRSSNGLLYVTSAYFGGGYIYVIDPATRTLKYSAVVGGSPRHVVFTADGSIGLVPNEGGWVDFLK